jgi:hypothetical protein
LQLQNSAIFGFELDKTIIMPRIYSIILLLLILASVYNPVVSQDDGAISTKRDLPIGIVSFGTSVTSGVLGNDNFIDGYIKKAGTETFVFPVGDNGSFRPFAAFPEQVVGAYFGVDPSVAVTSNPTGGNYGVLPAGGPFNASSIESVLSAVSKTEYWDINGPASTRITLSWDANSDINTLTAGRGLTKLTIAGWNGSQWVNIASTVDVNSIFEAPSTLAAGSLTTDAAIAPDTYNVYTLAAMSDGALPVVLVSFDASTRENASYLEWVTASEINSSHFEIERSADAKSWSYVDKVGAIKDAAVSGANPERYDFTDIHPLHGINFYRLKMVDRDGTFAYSRIAKVDHGADSELHVFPNPVAERLFLTGTQAQNVRTADLVDPNGRTIYSSKKMDNDGIDVSRMPQGLYQLKFSFVDGLSKSYKVLISR